MNGYEKRTREKREAILAAAEKLFLSCGYASTSIQNIARTARVSPTSIYNYFGSKKRLLITVFEHQMIRSIQEMDDYLDSTAPFQEKVLQIVTGNSQSFTPEENTALQSIPWDDPKIQSVYRDLGEKYSLPMFRKLIRLGKMEGAIAEQLPEEAVVAYFRSFMMIMTDPHFLQTSYSYKEGIHHLFFFGLLGEPPDYLNTLSIKEGE